MVLYLSVISVLSAFMVFAIQFSVSKMILPYLGGSFSVWTTTSFFFQLLLFVGYLYAGFINRFAFKKQIIAHSLFILITFVFLFTKDVSSLATEVENPTLWIVMTLAYYIGLPYLLVTTTSPLIQKWFSYSNYEKSSDPYFFYVASNIGSFAALISYPFIIEPNMLLLDQVFSWRVMYIVLTISIMIISFMLYKNSKNKAKEKEEVDDKGLLTKLDSLKIIALAFIPCSLSLATTTYITMDISSTPMLWMIPLAIYLLSFIVGFRDLSNKTMDKLLTLYIAMGLLYLLIWVPLPLQGLISKYTIVCCFLALFAVATVIHHQIYCMRPNTKQLTRFYILISFGSLLGSVFNSMLAPVIFKTFVEYKLMIIVSLCSLMLCHKIKVLEFTKLTKDKFKILFKVLFILILLLLTAEFISTSKFIEANFYFNSIMYMLIASFLIIYLNKYYKDVKLFTLMLCSSLLIFFVFIYNIKTSYILEDRSFYNVFTVKEKNDVRYLVSGKTIHGMQYIDEDKGVAYSYYKTIENLIKLNHEKFNKVGMVGLGAGISLCFAEDNQEWSIFEIDQLAVDIASNPEYFSYISNCKPDAKIVLGDARTSLEKYEDKYFDFLILDAFSSDSIPTHLLTKQALDIYNNKVNDGGILAIHISNLYLNLEPVLHNLVKKLNKDSLILRTQKDDTTLSSLSTWFIIGEDLNNIRNSLEYKETTNYGNKVLWSDDYAGLLSILR